MTQPVINATPYAGIPGMVSARYVSSHWWEEGTEPTLEERLTRKLLANPAPHYLIDGEKCRDQGKPDILLRVLQTFAKVYPISTRIVYDSQLRIAYPNQTDRVTATIAARLANPYEQSVYFFTDYVAHDVYLMLRVPNGNQPGVVSATSFKVDWALTIQDLDEYLALNAWSMAQAEAAFKVRHFPCVNNVGSTAKGASDNIVIPKAHWVPYNAKVAAKWPDRPRVWWGGSIRTNPGTKDEGYVHISEHDTREYAGLVVAV